LGSWHWSCSFRAFRDPASELYTVNRNPRDEYVAGSLNPLAIDMARPSATQLPTANSVIRTRTASVHVEVRRLDGPVQPQRRIPSSTPPFERRPPMESLAGRQGGGRTIR